MGPKSSPCLKQFNPDDIVLAKQDSLDLERKELDIALLASLRVLRSDSSTSHGKRTAIKYQFKGKQVCKSTFINGVGSKHLKNFIKFYEDNGLVSRVDKNIKKAPHNQRTPKN